MCVLRFFFGGIFLSFLLSLGGRAPIISEHECCVLSAEWRTRLCLVCLSSLFITTFPLISNADAALA
jgi:hypothetical protein